MKSAKSNQDNRVKMVKDTLYINNEKFVCGQNDIPVKVVYQQTSNNRSQNYNQIRLPSDRQYAQPYNRTVVQHQPAAVNSPTQQFNSQNYVSMPNTPQESAPRLTRNREKTSATTMRSKSVETANSFESRNIFTNLTQNDSGNDRYYAGKTKASSPLDHECDTKKHRDYVSDESYIELTPSPKVTESSVNLNNSRANASLSPNKSNTQRVTSELTVQTPVEIPQVIGAENLENHDSSSTVKGN